MSASVKAFSPRREAWRWYLGYLLARPFALFLAVLPSGLSALMTLPALWLLRFVIDTAIPQRMVGTMVLAGVGIFACRALAGITVVGFAKFSMPLARQATAQMRADLVAHLQMMRWTDHAGFEGTRAAGRVVTETERVEQLTHSLLYSVAPTLIPVAVYTTVLVYVSPWMALTFLVITPLLHLATRLTAKRLRDSIRVFQQVFERFNIDTHTLVQMLATARMQACEEQQRSMHRESVDDLSRAGAKMALAGITNSQTNILVVTAIAVVLLIAGGFAVARDMMTVGELGAFVFALTQINEAMSTMISAVAAIMAGDEALLRLNELRVLPTEDIAEGAPPPERWTEIRFDGVSFGYGDRPILTDQSIVIPVGKTTAIVAPNGVGKSSLLELVGGLHRPESGKVLLGDCDLAELDAAAWRRRIGFVPQHPALFRGTIRQNICFGLNGVDPAALDRAIHMAALDLALAAIPGGLDAFVGDRGQQLSGGERQRVAIARALLHHPELLILDEPTNHLDKNAIDALIDRLFCAPGRPTILVATHDARILAVTDNICALSPESEQLFSDHLAKAIALQ